MAFCRLWLLIFCALVLSGGQIRAASAREDRAYAAASAAFQDQNWERAAAAFADFSQRFPKSDRVAEAGLMKAQAEFKQGKFATAIATLSAPKAVPAKLADRYAYWLAEAQFAQGEFQTAAEGWAQLAKNFPDSPLALSAVVAAAAAWDKAGEATRLDALLTAPDGLFARAAQADPANEEIANGRLLLAHSKNSRADFAGANQVLNLLQPPTLKLEQSWKFLYELCRVKFGLNDFDGALAVTANLIPVARLEKNAGRLAASEALQAEALEKLGRLPEAAAAWTENLTTNAPAEKQREAVLKIAALAAQQNDFTNAAAKLGEYLGRFPDSPVAELVQLTLGEMQLKDYVSRSEATNQLVLAQSNFDRLITTSTNLPLVGKASLNRGWCEWLAGRTNESLGCFLAGAMKLPPSEDQAVAKFKAGDAMFALNDFAGAWTNYQSVLTDYSAWPTVAKSLGAPALYQSLRADLELTNAVAAEDAMRQLLEKFPASELADNSLLLAAEGSSDFGSPTNALRLCREFEQKFPDSPLLPQLEFLVAQIYEQEPPDWPSAIAGYKEWLKHNPTNDLLPQVTFALAQAHFHAGDDTNAFQLFSEFVAQFPTNDLAPLAQWWVADHFFNATNFAGAGNFVVAETNYENIYQNTNAAWQKSAVFYPAQKMAGLAAMGRLQFSDANAYFVKLLGDTNCPPDIAVQTRFAYSASLRQTPSTDTNNPSANLQTATNILGQIWRLYPTNDLGARAWNETGDCNLQMNDFDAATNAYAQVMNAPFAGVGLRNLAQVGMGIALVKKAALLPPDAQKPLLKQAFENYLNVIYTQDDGADPLWTSKAGWEALRLMGKLGTDQKTMDDFFARLETLLPTLRDALEQKRAALALKNKAL
jgi:outer membrane protein assembly factor BamD (BamD/ComL family)